MRLLTLTAALAVCAGVAWGQPVFDYVAAPDESFEWEKTGDVTTPAGSRIVRMEVVSQVWQGITWKHRIAIARPAQPRHPELAVLLITGGNPAGQEFAFATLIADMIGMPIAVLGDIPNQPLFEGLSEDALIAFTFAKFLETGDTSWPCLFPMTKGAVRAMDALQELSEQDWGARLEGFLVTGASKRGWTTWFTGVVDERVRAIMPMVYDNLNLPAQMAHHLEQWGDYSPMIRDYTQRGLPDLVATEQGRELAAMVDPYTYRDRLTMPKLTIAGTNDPYWPLGAADNYFDDLEGPNYLLYAPNSGHGLDDRMRVINGMAGFVAAATGEIAFPQLEWTFTEADGGVTLSARSDPAPRRALVWTAQSPTKDFRPARWVSEEVEVTEGGASFTLRPPEEGFAAVFMEFTFEVAGRDFPLSTQIRIVGGG